MDETIKAYMKYARETLDELIMQFPNSDPALRAIVLERALRPINFWEETQRKPPAATSPSAPAAKSQDAWYKEWDLEAEPGGLVLNFSRRFNDEEYHRLIKQAHLRGYRYDKELGALVKV